MIEALRNLRDAADVSRVAPITWRRLAELGYVSKEDNTYRLTTGGQEYLSRLDKPSAGRYFVQQWHKTPATEGLWADAPSPTGEPLSFNDEHTAEIQASRLSIVSGGDFRVIEKGVFSPTFTVFNFGQRYLQNELTGARVLHPRFIAKDNADETDGLLYIIQRRVNHIIGEGRFGDWEQVGDRRYLDYSEAVDSAKSQAQADTDAWDYRVTHDEVPQLEPVVYRREYQDGPDLALLDQLITIQAEQVDGDSLAARKLVAAGQMISDYVRANADQILTICIEALERASEHDLSTEVAAIRDRNRNE